MIWPAVIGAGASLVGGMLGGKGKAPKFKPFDITTNAGSVDMTKRGLTSTESGFNFGARNFFQDQFNQATQDPAGQAMFGRGVIGMGQQGFMPAFQNAQDAGFGMSDAALPGFMQNLQQLQGMFGGMGQQGMNAAFGSPTAAGNTAFANNAAMGLFNQFGNFDQLAQQQKASMDALALPQEQQASRSALQGLFNSGRLGTTGGANQMGQLAQAQQMADVGRGLTASQFAQQQQQGMLNQAQGFLGQAFSGIGMDQSRGLQLGQLGSGMLQQIPGLQSAGLQALIGSDTRNVSRAQDRLSAMEGLFGFGQSQMEAPIGLASRTLGAIAPLDAQQNQLIDQAFQGTAMRSKQGASGGGGLAGAAGGMLQGFGSGLFNSGMNSFFNKQNAGAQLDSLFNNPDLF